MLLPFIPLINKILDSVLPDSSEAKFKLAELSQKGELTALDGDIKIALGQIGVNTEEAKNINWFIAGWRPAVGWICTVGLGYQFLLQPILTWISFCFFHLPGPPNLDGSTLLSLLMGLLGLGGLRTYEKLNEVHNNH